MTTHKLVALVYIRTAKYNYGVHLAKFVARTRDISIAFFDNRNSPISVLLGNVNFTDLKCVLKEEVLNEAGVVVKTTDVIALAVPDKPGGLVGALELLKDKGIAIEYMYAFNGKFHNGSVVILRVNDNEKLLEIAKEKGLTLLSEEEAYATI